MRKIINMNFSWYFSRDFKESYLKDYQDVAGFELINIPHNAVDVPYSNFDERKTMIVSTYKKIINVKSDYESKDLELIFEGVAHKATIYVNDDFVSIHRGGYDRFKINIKEYIKFGEDNYITVIVDSTESPAIPPFGSFVDYLGYGGIYREVYLEVAEKEKILDFYIRTPNINNSITAYCDITVNTTPVEIVLTVIDGEHEVSVNKYNLNRECETFDFDVKEKINWDLENPKMYCVNIKMYSEKTLLDEVSDFFGFREVKVTKEGFFLNGQMTKLVGLNRHQSYPYVGYAMPKSAQERDAEILKYELGCNVVRTSHYMQSKHFLRKCDQIGLLVMEEIPGWQFIGDEDFKQKVIENVEAMIKRDRLHPSIIMWGVRINESVDDYDLYKKTNELARKLDTQRPTFGVRNFIESEFLEDVFTFNDFIYDGGKNITIRPQKTPFMITEHNGHMFPTKRFDDETHRLEHALRHIKVIDTVLGDDNINGVIGWCMNDYNTHKDFGSSDKICYHGVCDMFRIPKYAGLAYKSQKNDECVLEVTSSLARGDYQKSSLDKIYIFTNCEYVKMFKNDDFVDTYYPDKEGYPNLAHPPIIVTDMVGQILERKEKMESKHSGKLKTIMKRAIENGYKLSLTDKIKCFLIMRKYKRPVSDIYSLFTKYVVGEANKDFIYRFDGYTNENVIESVTIRDIKETFLKVYCDKETLTIQDTYDVTRVVVTELDQDGNLVPYGFTPIHIEVSGGIELIGPKDVTLLGGAIGFWVKTNQKGNTGTIDISSCKGNFKKEIVIEQNIGNNKQ